MYPLLGYSILYKAYYLTGFTHQKSATQLVTQLIGTGGFGLHSTGAIRRLPGNGLPNSSCSCTVRLLFRQCCEGKSRFPRRKEGLRRGLGYRVEGLGSRVEGLRFEDSG